MQITPEYFHEYILPYFKKVNIHAMDKEQGAMFLNEVFHAASHSPPIRPFLSADRIFRNNQVKRIVKWNKKGIFTHLGECLPELNEAFQCIIRAFKDGVPDSPSVTEKKLRKGKPRKSRAKPKTEKEEKKPPPPPIARVRTPKRTTGRGIEGNKKRPAIIPPPYRIILSDKWALAKDLIDLPANGCKYPLENTFCKKERTDDSSYCMEHHRLCRQRF